MTLPRPRRLVSVGSLLVDIRVEVPHLPEKGGDVLGSGGWAAAGGGFNILAAAARNDLTAIFAGRHGEGPNGDRIREALAREGILALSAPDPFEDSGFCVVLVEPDGERTFVTSPGVEARLGPRSLDDIAVREGDAIFVSGYDLAYPDLGPAIAAWAGALTVDALVVLDPGPLVAKIPRPVLDAVLRRARAFTLNRREAELFTGATDIREIFAGLRGRARSDALLIVRDGARGCDFAGPSSTSERVHVGALEVAMVDSTGAGDAHTGVLLASLASGLGPVAAVARANAAAAVSVTRRGPATAPTRIELDAFLAERAGRGKPAPGE